MNTARLDDVIQAVGPDFHGLSYRERLIVGAVLKRLSTPPADDVREALADVQWMEHGGVGQRDEWKRLGYAGAVAVLRAFEVRPRGTVTDAEVEAAKEALGHAGSGVTTPRMRAALEAAREVRS